ncbi:MULTISPECIES: hypothetical protein [Bacillus]|jgi:hypothetical protein|uniref:hypothetical protein n=1 Tax=Bacillus TaxID=1386 RepID=UPI00053AE382|nr:MULTISPECIES: hypothetical protein [Bacillus]AMK72382.1 hypothetical protein AWV81_09675 [Bacillus subtilis subsp. natto]API42079.1 hypothetical protein BSR08_05900 [Bacillus subtilis]API94865.1 hypothetical protein BKP58_02660 [Bacillus subtilis]ARI88395.1 hypothetical protein B7470_21235 [Bacillus subtilis]ASB69844.1 hypothetical protein S100333_01951 [Bacillus subtilis subsp. subtilis]
MKELPAHVEERLYEFFMKYSVPRILKKEAKMKNALKLAAFFAEFEQKMIKKNRLKVANFSNRQMVRQCHVYLELKGFEE